MTTYKIGVGKADITNDINTNSQRPITLQGYADPEQIVDGVLHRISSRAFVIQENKAGGNKVVLVNAEIWSCTKLLKQKVIESLQSKYKNEFTHENVHLSGTHTHSAPGGYGGYELYTSKGETRPDTLKTLVKGIVRSIELANKNLKPGKIYLNKGDVQDCGQQRSKPAYLNNLARDRNRYATDTDTEMLLLKFVHIKRNKEYPVGMVNWFGLHPTSLGQFNTQISGDNKGYASILFESYAKDDLNINGFVAAFANANGGDVSGNVGKRIDDGSDDLDVLEDLGEKQFLTAKGLFTSASIELSGPINTWYRTIDMSHIFIKNKTQRTWPFSLGISFAKGSSEDSIPRIRHPLTGKVTVIKNVKEGLKYPDIKGTKYEKELVLNSIIVAPFIKTLISLFIPKEEKKGQYPKPILITARKREWLAPMRVPIQILQIGQLAVLGVPGELTTMAGRKLREGIFPSLGQQNMQHVALGTYANDFFQYVTTRKEYDMQHYEGASTPYGPHTLDALVQEYQMLTQPADQYIDCICRRPKGAAFILEYVDKNGKTRTLSSRSFVKKFRFSVPHDVRSVKVRALYEKRPAKYTRWSHITPAQSGQAQKVILKGKSLQYEKKIEDKRIECTNQSPDHIFISGRYKLPTGAIIPIQSPKEVDHYHEFKLPWNAKEIQLQVGFGPRSNRKRVYHSNVLTLELGSHQSAAVKFLERSLRYEGLTSPW